MSFSWTYLTRRFIGQNYRDMVAVTIIGSYFTSKFLTYNSKTSDNNWTLVIILDNVTIIDKNLYR